MNNWHSISYLILSICLCLTGCWTPDTTTPTINSDRDRLAEKYSPSDEFFLQRSFPDLAFDINTYTKALQTVKERAIPRNNGCLLYTSPSPRDGLLSRMPSSA